MIRADLFLIWEFDRLIYDGLKISRNLLQIKNPPPLDSSEVGKQILSGPCWARTSDRNIMSVEL